MLPPTYGKACAVRRGKEFAQAMPALTIVWQDARGTAFAVRFGTPFCCT